ncbi:hypothetical protein Taro_005347, partial [Colocasia esculenta]|nr:hypothetical protein [Colocasia esculenta]
MWRSEVAVPVVRRCFSRGCSVSLVVTPGCSFLTAWRSGMLSSFASALLEFLLLWLGLAVARVRCRTVVVAAFSWCVTSSVSCERERLYRELRVAFLQVLG